MTPYGPTRARELVHTAGNLAMLSGSMPIQHYKPTRVRIDARETTRLLAEAATISDALEFNGTDQWRAVVCVHFRDSRITAAE